MNTLQETLAQLPNPFATQAVSPAEEAAELVDVASMAAPARQALSEGSARARAGRSQVVVLVGEAGAGKSHLLSWLRQKQRRSDDTAATHEPPLFLPVPALPDLAMPFRHALRVLVGALCKRDAAAGATGIEASELGRPLDRLLWDTLLAQCCDLLDAARVGGYQGPAALLKLLGPLCTEGGQRRRLADFAERAQKSWAQVEPGLRQYLLALPTEMSIDSASRAVLVQFPYADRRGLCTAWLAGEELSAKDRERLGAKQVINNEAAAKYVLCSLARMLSARPGGPLTLCYDQAEEVASQLGQPGLLAMAEVIASLQAQGGGLLQVLSCRPATWTRLQEKPVRAAPGTPPPLKSVDATVNLDKPTPADVRALVLSRLQAAFRGGPERPGALYPLADRDVEPAAWPGEVGTARAALAHFAQRFESRRAELVPGAGGAAGAAAAGGAKAAAKNAASAPGTGVPKRDAPSIPNSAAVTRKVAPSTLPAKPAKAETPIIVPVTDKAAKKDAPAPATAPAPEAKKPAPAAAKPAAKPAPEPDRNAPEPLPPSAQSPSIQWMAWASDNNPLADALAQARAELGGSSKPSAAKADAKPKTDAKPAKPEAKPAKAEPAKAAAAPAKAEAKPAAAKPAPEAAAKPADNVPEPLPPSAQSPSIQWSAWAAGETPFPETGADPTVAADASSFDFDVKSKPRSVRATMGMGVVLVNPAAMKAAAEAASQRQRPRSAKVAPRGGQSVNVTQVFSAMGTRTMIEEQRLAEELGVPVDALDDVLARLENEGRVRLMPMSDGQRMIVRET